MTSSSLSGPRGYITVRRKSKKGDQPPNELYTSYVENRPYLPLLNVDPANLDTVINVAKIIVSSLLCNNINDIGDGATNSNNDDTDIEEEEKVTVITGGLTNALFKVDLPNINGTAKYPSVLVRIFGADGMINRDEETANFVRLCNSHNNNVVHDQLDVLGRFGNGRVETWIPNMRQAHHIHDFKIEGFELEVARQLARLHYGFDVTNVAVVQDDDYDDGDQQQDRKKQHEPTLWKVIKTWIDELSQQLSHEKFQKVASSDASSTTPSLVGLFSFAIMNNDSYQEASSNDQIQQQCTDNIISSLYNELEWLKEKVTTNFPNASIVFCHNDVNAANILLDTTSVTSIDDNNNNDKDGEEQDQGTHSSNSYSKHNVCIIDYEYGSINYAMYDIANYICEHCGGNDNGIPNHDLLPTYDRLRKILIEYVNERDAILSSSKEEEEGGGGGGRKLNDGIDEEVAHLMSQVELFQMASNLYWGVWGVLQAAGEVVVPEEESDHAGASKFDNLEDAMSRLDGKSDLTRWDNLRYGSNRLKRYHVCKERMN